MQMKRIVSMLLVLTLIVGVLAPCRVHVHAEETESSDSANLAKVTEPVIGNSYYLGAEVDGTMMYFRTGSVTQTAPYSLVVTQDIDSATQLTAEDPSALTDATDATGFQLSYVNTEGTTVRIYCMDVLKDEDAEGQTGVMDTGYNSKGPYAAAHNFFVDTQDGKDLLTCSGKDTVMVIKELSKTVGDGQVNDWCMLFVDADELSNEGVYPVMLMENHEHTLSDGSYLCSADGHRYVCGEADCGAEAAVVEAHTYGAAVTDGIVTTRTCTTCSYVETVYDKTAVAATEAVIGESYYLGVNVDGTMRYFVAATPSQTDPYSLATVTSMASGTALTLESPSALTDEGADTDFGFQFSYVASSGSTARIYSYDVGNDGDVDTGHHSQSPVTEKHNFYLDATTGLITANNDNGYVLAAKELTRTVSGTEQTVWRMLFVEETELDSDGVYPVMLMQAHTHTASTEMAGITDDTHSAMCWCGAEMEAEAHTYGDAVADTEAHTHSRTCSVCGYVEVIHAQSRKQIKYPTVGGEESYYLSANVDGTMRYFVTGTVTVTTPYSLKTIDYPENATQVTLVAETVADIKGEFRMSFDNSGTTAYIYCRDETSDSVPDTGTRSKDVTAARCSFYMDEVNGVTVIRDYGDDYVLAVKEVTHTDNETVSYRMLGVAESTLANEGVYPAMLTVEHTHEYDETMDGWVVDEENGTQSRLCSVCGYVSETLHGETTDGYDTDDKVTQVTAPAVGGSYYLVANMGGTLRYFVTGTVTVTTPYSLKTIDYPENATQVTLVEETTENTGDFRMSFDNSGTTAYIYCRDETDDGVPDTGTKAQNVTAARCSFYMDEVNGVTVIREYGDDYVLAVKEVTHTDGTTKSYRMLGVAESELANEGVYPVMFATLHTHTYNETVFCDDYGHGFYCNCGSKGAVTSHFFDEWSMDRENVKQTSTCTVCSHTVTVDSPHFDAVESEEELGFGLADVVEDSEATWGYSVDEETGKYYYLTGEIDGERYYFRKAGKRTDTSDAESVTTTSAYSLYTTNDPNDTRVARLKVTPGNTAGTYVVTFYQDGWKYIYVNNEGSDGDVDTGNTTFRGVSTDATYLARSEFYWDETNARLYQEEGGVKYVLAFQELEVTYSNAGTVTEWRMLAVAESDLENEGVYPVQLARHAHNYGMTYGCDEVNHWLTCPCAYDYVQPHTADWYMDTVPSMDENGDKVDGHKSGTCTACAYAASLDVPYPVEDWGVNLGENIGVRFRFTLAADDVLTVKLDGTEQDLELTDNNDGTYDAFVPLAAAEMTDEITVSVGSFTFADSTTGAYTLDETFSVRTAALAIQADGSNEYAKELAAHMLAYGGAAQTLFDEKINDLAGEAQTVTMPEGSVGIAVSDALSGVDYYGASLRHESSTAIRFYFTADSVSGLTFTVDSQTYTPVAADGMYYIEVPGILPNALGKDMAVTVSDGTNTLSLTYNPVSYLRRTYSRSDASENLKSLAQQMYGYYEAAVSYGENMAAATLTAISKSSISKTTADVDGISRYKLTYSDSDGETVTAYATVVSAEANVELKVSAGTWSDSSTADDPGETKLVKDHFKALQSSETVLAMVNGGFFDRTTNKTMKPYGMQIVDGVVYQAPSTTNVNYTDNWFGMTTDGAYVISDTAGYESNYTGKIQQGVGGGKLLIANGEIQDLDSTDDARTAVGINADGDLILLVVDNASYTEVATIFKNIDSTVQTVLNLDGGGSTAMYRIGTSNGKVTTMYVNDNTRKVADAIGIVVKD